MSSNTRCQINGTVEPGFESVRQLYEHNMQAMAEENTQLCVYYQGRKVVDLWATTTDDKNFNADSLINVFSSGKSLEAIAVASLVSKGLINYDTKIIDYWPEFANNGKTELSIADVMRHEAGLAGFDSPMDMEDLLTENIKLNKVGLIIENHRQRFPRTEGNHREYHAVTRGWIVNEFFRRVDPTGRTIGEYLREEVSQTLDADVFIGLRKEELARVSKIKPLGFGYQLLESLKPKLLGRKIVHNFFQIAARLIRMISSGRKSATTSIRTPPFKGMQDIGFFSEPGIAMGETPSAAANCSARGLAKVAAMISAGGSWQGKDYLSPQALQAMHENPVQASMGGVLTTRFTQGGVDQFLPCGPDTPGLIRAFNEGREGFYGWMGLGGSIFQWHPQLDIGFSFVPTSLHVLDFLNERGKTYQAEVLQCVDKLNTQ